MILFQPKTEEYDQALDFAKEKGLGFELTQFMFYPALEDDGVLRQWVKRLQGAPVKVLHGPFADLNFSGGDPEIFAVSQKRIERCCVCASELGVHKMVLHSCFFPLMTPDDPLYRIWSRTSADFLRTLSEKYDITFCVENMLDINPDIIVGMLEACEGHPGVRVCLDAGHANLTRTPIDVWNRKLSPWQSHFHLSDNHGVYDEHIALGTGTVDWGSFFATLSPQGGNVDYTLEVSGLARVIASYHYLEQQKKLSVLGAAMA